MRRSARCRAAILAVAAGLALAPAGPARADMVRDLEYWLDDYGIREAWNTTRGAGVTVAVIDSGIAPVPELAGAVLGGTDVSGLGEPDGRTPVGQGSEHGTLVGTILAGRGTGEGDGMIGVAPEATLLSVSVGFDAGTADVEEQIAEAVRWSVDNGADVINMSLTTNTLDWPESWDDAFLYAFEHDVVVVAAAGNRGSGTDVVGAPATIPGVVAVAGVDREGNASFDASSQGITIAVAAPSEELVGITPDGDPVYWSGTSGAAPIVSGVVALIRSAHPELDADDAINRLIRTATPKGEPVPGPIYGYGLVNAAAAVTADVPPVDANPLAVPYDLEKWITLYRQAESPVPLPDEDEEDEEAAAPPPEEPRAADPVDLLPVWLRQALPTTAVLTDAVLPLGVLGGFAALLAAGVVGTVRSIRRTGRR
ncbi:S8 family serine peptidase [Naasia sp. SYSU D00948]|uniref:S8 family serine peptidase n=1 Tax=Naasia sp. SYSU D00948 TaxID=2817379 RepID=UPI0027DD86CB|nr:S8 family serine peptidase [Naasia sp. SYSU D00948]